MFESILETPPDPILGLGEAFRADPRTDKVNLTVGVYQDNTGGTPVLATVKEAERRLLANEHSKGYLGIAGDSGFNEAAAALLLGSQHPALQDKRMFAAHTPGGTGALRVAADFIASQLPGAAVWMPDPTWPNHPQIFAAAGVPTKSFPWYDAQTHRLNFSRALESIESIPPRQIVLLHGCCHNPTGQDPDASQWGELARALSARQLLPLVDFAYQGFGDGLQEDAVGLRILLESCPEALVCTSYSKNFGLYRERVGALLILCQNKATAVRTGSQCKRVIRCNYSNPPAHGGLIVDTILNDLDLRANWEQELAVMRERLNTMRREFAHQLNAVQSKRDFSFLAQQRGMFSFSGLNPEQVDTLRERDGIYLVRSGRLNVAGLNSNNLSHVAERIASVL